MEELCNSRQILRFVKGYKRERGRGGERGRISGGKGHAILIVWSILQFFKSNLVVSTLGGLILLELNREDCISNIVEIWYL